MIPTFRYTRLVCEMNTAAATSPSLRPLGPRLDLRVGTESFSASSTSMKVQNSRSAMGELGSGLVSQSGTFRPNWTTEPQIFGAQRLWHIDRNLDPGRVPFSLSVP